ncbi:MAG TPA: PAS domain S-box protein [Planctomycetota bacterium]|nr:PAS domain S-box protein [Planctomycetota bacterium]
MLAEEKAVAGEPWAVRGPVVLVVDDQSEILEALRRLLRKEPYELLTTESPDLALERIRARRVDLVIADERMPGMRGTDLLEQVQECSPGTVRIILTGYPGSATLDYGLSQAVDWLISKPWNDDALRLTIRQLLEEGRTRARNSAKARRRPHSSAPGWKPPLRWSEWLADFCDVAAFPLHFVGTDGVILWANQAEAVQLGYALEDLVGHRVTEFHADPATAEDLLGKLARREEFRDFPVRIRCKDGIIREIILDSRLAGPDGRFVHSRLETPTEAGPRKTRDDLEAEIQQRSSELRQANAELIHEMAERTRAEDSLRLNEVRFRLLVESVTDYAILMLSPEGVIVSWNIGAERINGYRADEILGHSFTRLFTPEDVEAGKPPHLLRKAMEEGRAEDEGWRVRKDGTRFWSNAVLTAIRDSGGNLLGFSKVTRDMTERRKAEEERAKLSSQMLQGQKLQAIGQLSAGIAHEINNPVGYILSNLNTLGEYCEDLRRMFLQARQAAAAARDGRDPWMLLAEFSRLDQEIRGDELADDLQQIVADCSLGTERIRDIVRSLREFSHVDQGQLKPTNLNHCLEDALRICWNELKYKAEIRKDYGELPLVPCYPQRMGQVFINLLVNAGQAIEKKGEVFLSTRVEGEEVVASVRDTGCGISPENLGKIFEPFFTTKPVGSGTGLGLHVAYKIVTAHGGRIGVTSKLGGGTEFSVRIPVSSPRAR